jgi:hypothetical protein
METASKSITYVSVRISPSSMQLCIYTGPIVTLVIVEQPARLDVGSLAAIHSVRNPKRHVKRTH